MDPRSLALTLLRRWPITLVVLLVVVGVVAGVASVVQPTYTSTSSVVLLPPKDPAAGASNPYLALGSLDAASDVIVASLGSEEVVAAMRANFPTAQALVTKDPTASAPFILITVTASDSNQATAEMRALTNLVLPKLNILQAAANVQRSAYITTRVVTQDQTPIAVQKSRTRLVALSGLLMLLLGILMVVSVDARLSRRTGGARAVTSAHVRGAHGARIDRDAMSDASEGSRPGRTSSEALADERQAAGKR